MSPQRAPNSDAIIRCRDVIDIIISAPGHKYNCERNELLQLLSQSHVQVSGNFVFSRFGLIRFALRGSFLDSVSGKYCQHLLPYRLKMGEKGGGGN